MLSLSKHEGLPDLRYTSLFTRRDFPQQPVPERLQLRVLRLRLRIEQVHPATRAAHRFERGDQPALRWAGYETWDAPQRVVALKTLAFGIAGATAFFSVVSGSSFV